MVASIPFNPNTTTNAAGSFNTTTNGFVQGTALDSPTIRYQLAGGVLASTETIPMWGGVGITENIPWEPNTTAQPLNNLGGVVGRATTVTAGVAGVITGFSVFDQNYAAINSPQSPVPLIPSGGQVNYYRIGSDARIAVKCDPALISLDGLPITTPVSWDFTAQQLVKASPAYAAVTITGATWASTSGGQYTFTVSTNLSAVLVAGNIIDVSGIVSTFAGISPNGQFVVAATPGATTVVVTAAAAANAGAYTSGGTIAAGGGTLPVQGVLQAQQTNCMTVSYDSVTGFATWNRNGACAVLWL